MCNIYIYIYIYIIIAVVLMICFLHDNPNCFYCLRDHLMLSHRQADVTLLPQRRLVYSCKGQAPANLTHPWWNSTMGPTQCIPNEVQAQMVFPHHFESQTQNDYRSPLSYSRTWSCQCLSVHV